MPKSRTATFSDPYEYQTFGRLPLVRLSRPRL
jgi:hypothetical protein